MRFEIRRSQILTPLLSLLGGTRDASYVEVGDEGLHCKFGFLFDETFPYAEILRVERDRWPWYGGIGWRTSLAGQIAIVGSLEGVVRIDLTPGRKARLILMLPCRQLFVSLERADDFVRVVRERLQEAAGRG